MCHDSIATLWIDRQIQSYDAVAAFDRLQSVNVGSGNVKRVVFEIVFFIETDTFIDDGVERWEDG